MSKIRVGIAHLFILVVKIGKLWKEIAYFDYFYYNKKEE